MKTIMISLVCTGLVLLAGCVSKGKYNSVRDEMDQLTDENAQLTQDKDQRAREQAKTTQERDELAATAAAQDAEMEAMRADYEALAILFVMEIEANNLRVKMLADGIELAIPSDVLYKSGAATPSVGDEGREQAVKIADFLAKTDYFISVVGHTDNRQPGAKLAKKYPTNWDLAAARASNAAKFFVSQGVDPTRIMAVSRGEFEPVASNDTPEGRAENRRIQIILRRLPE